VLARVLERAGHAVWWDRHIDTGTQFSKEIEEALENADVVVVAWSAHAIESPWVRDEAAIGRDRGRFLPITVDGCDPPIGFRQFQTLDLAHWRGGKKDARTEALLRAVDRRLKSGPTTTFDARAKRKVVPSARLTWNIRVVSGMALVLLLVIGAIIILRAERPKAVPLAVAVLPFSDLSPTHDKAFLAQGIGEQILSSLGTLPKLRVIGRTSATALGPEADPQRLRSRLGITHVIEGSARTYANDLRVDVRLIRTSDGSEIWTQEYRGGMGDIFRIEDNVASSVAQQLNFELARWAKPASEADRANVGAYEMYLAARALQRERSVPKLREAWRIAHELVTSKPNYARGHALLAELTYMLSSSPLAYGDIPPAKARPIAVEQAKEAIRLAPNAPEGYAALGLAFGDSPTPESIAALKKAILLDPSRAELRVWLGLSLDFLGRNDQEAEEYRKASEIEPLWPVPLLNWVSVLAASNRASEALKLVDQFRRRGGAPAQAWGMEAQIRFKSGDLSGAVAASQHALAADANVPGSRVFIARALRFFGFQPWPDLLGRIPSPFLHDLIEHREEQMRTRIAADPRALWNSFGETEVVRSLGQANDWRDIVAIYDAAPPELRDLCVTPTYFVPTIVWALRKSGRANEGKRIVDCFQSSIARQLKMMFRSTGDLSGELEEQQAGILALSADRRAIDWLNRAVDRGWVGQFFSPNLHEWREFDALWADPRMNAVQQRINAIYVRERAETSRVIRR
jgi:TolB-like protein